MSATNNVQVTYRHVELAAAAPLTRRDDGNFRLGLDAPPPVKTVLSIVDGDTTRALEVIEVIEVVGAGADAPARGCVLREVAADRLPTKVGSEHLRDAALGSAEGDAPPPVAQDDDAGDSYGAHMAVPAPVVADDSDEATDDGAREATDDGGEPNDDGDAGDSGSDRAAEPTTTSESGAESGAESGSGRAKKRRGRQRK